MKIVFVASIIRNSLCIIYGFFDYFLQKSIFTENYFLVAAINLATRGPLCTCLVFFVNKFEKNPSWLVVSDMTCMSNNVLIWSFIIFGSCLDHLYWNGNFVGFHKSFSIPLPFSEPVWKDQHWELARTIFILTFSLMRSPLNLFVTWIISLS